MGPTIWRGWQPLDVSIVALAVRGVYRPPRRSALATAAPRKTLMIPRHRIAVALPEGWLLKDNIARAQWAEEAGYDGADYLVHIIVKS